MKRLWNITWHNEGAAVDKLDDSIRSNVAIHSYWLPDEAASLYDMAFAAVSMECHSPILAIPAGTLAFYVRQPEDTHKGEMDNNLSIGDWEFMIDDADGRISGDSIDSIISDSVLQKMLRKN